MKDSKTSKYHAPIFSNIATHASQERDMVRSENPGQQHQRRGICNRELESLIQSRPWPVRMVLQRTLAWTRGS